MRPVRTSAAFGVFTAGLALPLLGAWLAGRALPPLLRFPPPLDIPTDFPRFSWLAAALVFGAAALVAWPWSRRWWTSSQTGSGRPAAKPIHRLDIWLSAFDLRRFPCWGWAAVAWTLGWWWLAWTRQPWFGWGQRYTFTPLWLGLIVTANALTAARGGVPLLRRDPGKGLTLFAASAAFWWGFEWLNRFVRNWHYLGGEGVGAWEYAIHSSICFSTVLPAVAGVREWLATMPRLQTRLARGPAWPWLPRRAVGAMLAWAGAAGLVLTGAQPLYFYPALWVAPLLIGVGLSMLGRRDGWWRELAEGDWRDAGSWALAALGCGLFWEMWNLHSLAKWVYTVPFVQRWRVFEMPLLGYSGYLTFGLECALAAAWVLGREPIPEKSGWAGREKPDHVTGAAQRPDSPR